MGRSSTFPAVILRSRECGEANRIITLFSADQGIVDALLYGGPKSKLKSLASPYHSGRAWIYYDPVRDSRKVSDFDPESTYPGIRARLRPALHAALWAELLIRSRAGGSDFEHAFLLLVNCLKALDDMDEDDAPYASFVFLWGYSGLLGLRPDPRDCSSCAGQIPADGVEYYSIQEGGFVCGSCRSEEGANGAFIPVPPGVARYLERLSETDVSQALRLRLDEKGRVACQKVAFALARRMAEGELNALETGEGML